MQEYRTLEDGTSEHKTLENEMIEYCSPTLAGLKTANMFSHKYTRMEQLLNEIEDKNCKFNRKGIFIDILRYRQSRVLIYVYRKEMLSEELRVWEIREFLRQYDYRSCEQGECLTHLKKRMRESGGFPHEVGIFLGYPLSDVVGFIENEGKNYKCCGIWKVYSNEQRTLELFEKYKKCTERFSEMYAEGKPLIELTKVVSFIN